MSEISFKPRWREELVASSADGALVFEMTFGQYHVYFPTQARWETQVPDWARPRWSEYHDACQRWCAEQRIPFTLVDDAHVTQDS